MKVKFLILTILSATVLMTSCDKNEVIVDVKLHVSPDTLIINDYDTSKIILSTQPKGDINFQVTQKPDWLTLEPMSGKVNGDMVPVSLRPSVKDMEPGTYTGTISITSDIAGSLKVLVTMQVKMHPRLKASVTQLTFPENVSQAVFEVENTGTGILNWSISNPAGWIKFSKYSGSLSKGQKNAITVTCQRAGLNIDTYTSTITINSNSEDIIQPIPVSMVVPKMTLLEITSKNVMLDYFSAFQSVYLINSGNSDFNWSTVNENNIHLDKTSGTLSRGDSVKIDISPVRANLQTGTFNSNIIISFGMNGKDTIKVGIKNFISSKWILDKNVIDAEFCRTTNMIIIASSNPNTLSVINPDTRSIETISLNTSPKCISINKSGDKVAIGHNGLISVVSLNTKSIEHEYPVSCDVLDVILTSSGWIYAFPVRDQWTRIRCINPVSGAETLQTGNYIYAGTMGALHPGENWIYGANNGLSPSDIEKYSIQNGTATLLYDSPYHGDYPMNGYLWFSEDGDRIFTRGRTVLRTGADNTSDMIYNGTVSCTKDIRTLFHSKIIDKFFLVTHAYNSGYTELIPASEIMEFNYTYLNYIKKYTLEQFIVPVNQTEAKFVNAEANFIFVNKDGTTIYAIVRANKSSGLLNDWAIQNIAIQ